jgi:hypothetical protein
LKRPKGEVLAENWLRPISKHPGFAAPGNTPNILCHNKGQRGGLDPQPGPKTAQKAASLWNRHSFGRKRDQTPRSRWGGLDADIDEEGDWETSIMSL